MNQINPMKLLQLKAAWEQFKLRHPKFPPFLNTLMKDGVSEGTILEIHITRPDGSTLTTNLRVTQEDMDLISQAKDLMSAP